MNMKSTGSFIEANETGAAPRRLEAAEPVDLAVGRRIRDLRRARALPLKAVAARTGLSIGFLSQIERGLSSPSLRALALLSDLFGVGLAGLFSGSGQGAAADPIVTRAGARPELKLWRSGISKQLLSPAGQGGRLNLFLVFLDPGATTGDEMYTHDGEEAGLVLEGAMTLTVGDETRMLAKGDSFRFSSRRPHRFANPSAEAPATVMWVNCLPPPTVAASG